MKTITEFPSQTLKNAAQTKQDLIASGKAAEELAQAMGESLKLEGERLSYILNALEAIGTHVSDLKRVVVFSLNEGEKAPHRAVQKGEQYYLVEYYPSLEKKAPRNATPQGDEKGKSRGKRRGKRGNRSNDRRETGEKNKFKPRTDSKKSGPIIRPKITPVDSGTPSGAV